LDRGKEFLDDIILKHEGTSILAVTHGGIVSSIVRLVLQHPY
jgi:broad specificity phosphatase PhoE